MLQKDKGSLQNFAASLQYEWLETNGLGGWAGTTVAGAHSRRYHGLLVAATEPPAGRTVLLSRLDETLHVGGESFELSCNQFPGAIAPPGLRAPDRVPQGSLPRLRIRGGRRAAAQDRGRRGRREFHARAL